MCLIFINMSNCTCSHILYSFSLPNMLLLLAFMYVKSSEQTLDFPEPNVISSSGLYDFVGRFAYTGTRDYTAYASIHEALDFCEYVGGFERMMDYNHGLVVEVAHSVPYHLSTSHA